MMKKQYIKPSMKVFELHTKPQLLVGSGYPNDWDGPIGYTPGLGTDSLSVGPGPLIGLRQND